MLKKLRLCIGIVLIACVCACTKSDDATEPEAAPPIVLATGTATTHTFSSEGGQWYVNFQASEPWTVSGADGRYADWCVASAHSGEAGDCRLSFSALPNGEAGVRSKDMTIECGGTQLRFTLMQSGATQTPPMTEAEVRACLEKLYQDMGGADASLSPKWCTDAPIDEWDNAVSYKNGQLTLRLAEKNLKGYVDLSGCTALVGITLDKNQLSHVNVEGCTQLETLSCASSSLKGISVTGCRKLKLINVCNNDLTDIDLSTNLSLQDADLGMNHLSSLDLQNNFAMTSFACYENNLTELRLNCPTTLSSLFCYNNALRQLDLDGYVYLSLVNCSWNKLTRLSLNRCRSLSRLYCIDNSLTELDLSSTAKELWELYCGFNSLTSLQLPYLEKLSQLECSYNALTSLDLSSCPKLSWLMASGNQLESLDLTPVPGLGRLEVDDNRLQSLDILPCPYLWNVHCTNNNIKAEITERYAQLQEFSYDQRYTYSNGGYHDNGKGWWYAGEPQSGRHGK